MIKLLILPILTLFACASSPKYKNKKVDSIKSESMKIKAVEVLSGFGVIWGFDFLPDGKVIMSIRNGEMWIFEPTTKKIKKLSGVPDVAERGQGGLLDVRVHPRFKENRWIYLSYSVEKANGFTTEVSRSKLVGNKLQNTEIVFTAQPSYGETRHFGSRIVFDGKGHIFVSVGDRGNRKLAQSLKTHNGKIIRLHEDGSVPKDNPFVGKKPFLPEIWSYGHRNPQGLAKHPLNNEIWEQEHGPRGGDEINWIRKGKNYGWPVVTYGREYSGRSMGEGTTKVGMEQPLKYYVPSIAPSGFMIYSGKIFKNWKGDFFSGALSHRHLNRLKVRGKKVIAEEKLLENLSERIRNVREDKDGYIYVSTDGGSLIKLTL